MGEQDFAKVLTGTLSNVNVTNTVAEVFFRSGDREGMASAGFLAAALGESGLAAGMTSMSMEEMSDQVCVVSFDLDGNHVEGMLWNWPFKDGDVVQAVVEPTENGGYVCFAVADPKEKIIALYPHVSAGARAHWRKVIKLSFLAGFVPSTFFLLFLAIIGEVVGVSLFNKPLFMLASIFGCTAMIFFIGIRLGRRFVPFIDMAEPIFTLLGWNDVKNIDLRKITKAKKKPTDPPAMGDSYFRY
ncbi:putative type VI secretion system effector [Xanthomonas oryzae pv. oryzicola]|uniref:putative type VI secretion system effector n=1 Tax=Xanthomonas oryzae TaxID=347 RepID=UPI000655F5FC|nr:hypothetical protein ACU17_12945 [Xanthomonas oryzae pv. oryzicola]